MFYAWILDMCYASKLGITGKTGPTGEILRVLFESFSPAEFEIFLYTLKEYKDMG